MNTSYNKVSKVRQVYEKVCPYSQSYEKKKKKNPAKKSYTSNFETVCEIKSTTMFSRELLKTK